MLPFANQSDQLQDTPGQFIGMGVLVLRAQWPKNEPDSSTVWSTRVKNGWTYASLL